MPSSSVFQARVQSDVAASTMLSSGTDSVGTRLQGFAARTGPSTVTGGDFTVTAIVIDRAAATLYSGQTLQLNATATVADGTADATPIDTWASDTTACATVSATGLVTVVGAGTTNITAAITAGSITSSACVITVVAVLGQLIIADSTLSFAHTTTGTTTVTAKDQFGASMALPSGVAVASSNEAKATVGISTGTITVTGVAAGTTNVTASKSGITSNTCVVTLS